MTHAELHIVNTYSELFESLSKLELLEWLAKSIKKGRKSNEKDFFRAFASDKPAEVIIKDIRESRKFKTSDLKF